VSDLNCLVFPLVVFAFLHVFFRLQRHGVCAEIARKPLLDRLVNGRKDGYIVQKKGQKNGVSCVV
jgi:hypothetical protein